MRSIRWLAYTMKHTEVWFHQAQTTSTTTPQQRHIETSQLLQSYEKSLTAKLKSHSKVMLSRLTWMNYNISVLKKKKIVTIVTGSQSNTSQSWEGRIKSQCHMVYWTCFHQHQSHIQGGNLPVKKFLKSIKNWQNYGHESVALFFGPPCSSSTLPNNGTHCGAEHWWNLISVHHLLSRHFQETGISMLTVRLKLHQVGIFFWKLHMKDPNHTKRNKK